MSYIHLIIDICVLKRSDFYYSTQSIYNIAICTFNIKVTNNICCLLHML